ncbi:MAG: hypothetical protein ABI574_12825 [Burkholderiales bacterium]
MPIQQAAQSSPRNCAERWSQLGASIVLLALALHVAGARADDAAPSMFSLSGFGTLGVVRSSDKEADFAPNAYQPKGPGFSRRWSATPDSKLGAQVTANFSDKLSATVQVVSQYQYDETFTPYVEWANIKYQITPDFSVRAGRIALPTLMYSDSVNVGYALPFVRLPIEVSGQLPVTHSDGVDTSYRFRVGEVTNTVQAFAGNYDAKVPSPYTEFNIRKLRGIVDTIEYGDLTLRASYQKLHYSFLPVNVNAFQQIMALGASYDPGPWFVSAERVRAPDSNLGLFYGWYAVSGVRADKFTPYLGYARTYMTNVGSLGFPPFINQDTATAGLRWDFRRNTSLKVQFDHTQRHGGWNVYFLNQQPAFKADGAVNLFSLAVDFVF